MQRGHPPTGYPTSCRIRLVTAAKSPPPANANQHHKEAVQIVNAAIQAAYVAPQLANLRVQRGPFPVFMFLSSRDPLKNAQHCLTLTPNPPKNLRRSVHVAGRFQPLTAKRPSNPLHNL